MGLDMPTRAGVYMRQSHEQNINNQAENVLLMLNISWKPRRSGNISLPG